MARSGNRAALRVGLLGGSFDPVHTGHLRLASAALTQLKLDRLYFVLARQSPFKGKGGFATLRDRLMLLRAAIRGQKKFRVASWELRRRGRSYTVETLRRYQKQHPRHALYFVLGSDALAGFLRWRNPREILKRATLVVGRRPGTRGIRPPFGHPIRFLRGRFPDVSSTRLRRDLSSGVGVGKQLPTIVKQLIRQRGLYGE